MPWNLDSKRPIYEQILERVQLDIVTGHYKAGDKLPSVRDLAAEAAVNPNTMQKALSELERSGLLYAQRTSGRYVTDDKTLIKTMKSQLATMQVREFITKMKQLGLANTEIIGLIQDIMREESI
ncbi:MAG TPA: GntR family transcriptional regulator [Candidatus Pelethocola excrementipullorum]|nr:GntR family transcriptional regulator [Candidatus Pelethocola excrementipullorum]